MTKNFVHFTNFKDKSNTSDSIDSIKSNESSGSNESGITKDLSSSNNVEEQFIQTILDSIDELYKEGGDMRMLKIKLPDADMDIDKINELISIAIAIWEEAHEDDE